MQISKYAFNDIKQILRNLNTASVSRKASLVAFIHVFVFLLNIWIFHHKEERKILGYMSFC